MAEFQFQILIDDEDVGEAEKAKQERMMLSCTFLSRSPLDLSGRRCPSLMVLPVCLSMRISERERERERLEEWKKENRKSIASGRGKTVDCGVDGPRGRASECRLRKSPRLVLENFLLTALLSHHVHPARSAPGQIRILQQKLQFGSANPMHRVGVRKA